MRSSTVSDGQRKRESMPRGGSLRLPVLPDRSLPLQEKLKGRAAMRNTTLLLCVLAVLSGGCKTPNRIPTPQGASDAPPVYVLDVSQTDRIFDIPKLDGFPVMAAEAGHGRCFEVEILDAYKLRLDASDFSTSFRLAWDDRGLLFFATIIDDQRGPAVDSASVWSGNGDQLAIYITPEPGVPCARIVVGLGAESDTAASTILFTPPFEAGSERPEPVPATFERSIYRTDPSLDLAMRIPWSDLGILAEEGVEIGFQVLFQDSDGGGVHRWYPELGTARDSSRTHRLRLTGVASDPVSATVDRLVHLSDESLWITASAPIDRAGQRLRIVDGDRLLAEVDLVDDGTGYARVQVVVDANGTTPFPLRTPHAVAPSPSSVGPTTFMKAGVASRDITLLDCLSGQHQVVDPLFGKVLVLEDADGVRIAILSLDQLVPDLPALRERMRNELGIEHTFSNTSHTHSVARPSRTSEWYPQTEQLLWDAAVEATSNLRPVTLSVGRSPVEIGYNRNRAQFSQATVPWVNVLVVNPTDGDQDVPLAVLFEYAAHPVITQNGECISADYPAYAARRIRSELGRDVTPMFVQGCGGSGNAWPAGFDCEGSWDERANKAGQKLGEAVLEAISNAGPLRADRFTVRHKEIVLPCQLPSPEQYDHALARLAEQDPPWHTRESWASSLAVVADMMDRGETPVWPAHVDAIMLGDEWCLIAMPGEVYAEYELWIDRHVPQTHKMVMAYTNGPRGHYYIPTDTALNRGIADPLVAERACNWAASWPAFFSGVPVDGAMLPLAPGTERIIQDAVTELTSQPANCLTKVAD
jgi:hypothetical protein